MNSLVLAAGAVGLAGLLATAGFLVYLHLAPTGLSPLRNPVSQYGISAFRGGYRGATLSFAVAGAAAAVGIGVTLRGQQPATLVGLLVAFAAARALISWFPMDAPGAAATGTGQMHRLLAFLAFGAATAAAFVLGPLLRAGSAWHGLAPVSTGLGWAMLATVVLMLLGREGQARAWFGAAERGFYLAALAWFSVFAVACLT